ncbi:hypothetical protein WA026_001591 [Henosepilachna vigintioctopunctata]|uniref:Ankyrin repeat protein n=1 Tax=Henosepilachna vigintioctopunctata TaxID=420089 RepID=A0AAW1USE7_9CUCU
MDNWDPEEFRLQLPRSMQLELYPFGRSTWDAIGPGENINMAHERGNTLVHIACKDIINPNSLKNLLRCDPNFNIHNYNLQTPLQYYMLSPFLQSSMLETILKRGADPNITDALGNTSLYYLVLNPFQSVDDMKLLTKNLLKYNANVNIQNYFGDTPLHFAVKNVAVDFISALLHTEASVFIKNEENLTALDIAYNNRYDYPEVFIEMVKFAIIFKNRGIPVDQMFLDEIQSNESLRIFNDECKEERSRIKKITVGNTDVTLHVILKSSTHAFAKYLQNSEILEWFRNFESEEYIVFGNRINRHFKEGLARKEAEEYGYLFCRNILQTLPAGCHDNILSYFSNDDLHNLKWIRRN